MCEDLVSAEIVFLFPVSEFIKVLFYVNPVSLIKI